MGKHTMSEGSQHPAQPELVSAEEFLELSTPRCAVLGRPVEHSQSPLIHRRGYEVAGVDMLYTRVEAGEAREFRQLLGSGDPLIRGFSVTMPGKSIALDLADAATARAQAIGAANTLVHREDGTWLADNTDVDGVTACLAFLQHKGSMTPAGSQAVVVGNGGTARPAVAALAAAGVRGVTVAARSERALNLQALALECGLSFDWVRLDSPDLVRRCAEASVVVSTIPDAAAAQYAASFTRAAGIVDVIYDPYPTALMRAAEERSIPYADGLRMLAGQAEEQFRLFTGVAAPAGLFLQTLREDRPGH
ncbi:shikimate dehydrogenase [Corynebacterium heidelbergense]|nr:shikimate dehydrogenase [Corynebacterium heidelbergense]